RRLRLRLRNAFQHDFESDHRAFGAEGLERPRMQLAKMTKHVLRPDLDRARTAWMKPSWPARHDLQRLRRRADRDPNAAVVGLRMEGIGSATAIALRPMPSEPGRCRQTPPQSGGSGELILRLIAAKDLTDLEHADVRQPAIGVSLRGSDKARNKARPYVGKLSSDRVGERKLGLAAAEQFRQPLGDERPGNRLEQIARRQCTLGLASAHLDRGQNRVARIVTARKRRRRHTLNPENSNDLFDDVGFVAHVWPPRGDRDLDALTLAGDEEAEAL